MEIPDVRRRRGQWRRRAASSAPAVVWQSAGCRQDHLLVDLHS